VESCGESLGWKSFPRPHIVSKCLYILKNAKIFVHSTFSCVSVQFVQIIGFNSNTLEVPFSRIRTTNCFFIRLGVKHKHSPIASQVLEFFLATKWISHDLFQMMELLLINPLDWGTYSNHQLQAITSLVNRIFIQATTCTFPICLHIGLRKFVACIKCKNFGNSWRRSLNPLK
jgi:hypothetical protein